MKLLQVRAIVYFLKPRGLKITNITKYQCWEMKLLLEYTSIFPLLPSHYTWLFEDIFRLFEEIVRLNWKHILVQVGDGREPLQISLCLMYSHFKDNYNNSNLIIFMDDTCVTGSGVSTVFKIAALCWQVWQFVKFVFSTSKLISNFLMKNNFVMTRLDSTQLDSLS